MSEWVFPFFIFASDRKTENDLQRYILVPWTTRCFEYIHEKEIQNISSKGSQQNERKRVSVSVDVDLQNVTNRDQSQNAIYTTSHQIRSIPLLIYFVLVLVVVVVDLYNNNILQINSQKSTKGERERERQKRDSFMIENETHLLFKSIFFV
jgi:hypothetical protein